MKLGETRGSYLNSYHHRVRIEWNNDKSKLFDMFSVWLPDHKVKHKANIFFFFFPK